MNSIEKYLILNDSVLITFVIADTLAEDVMKIHKLSEMSAAELIRTLTLTVFAASGFKNKSDKLSVIMTFDDCGQKIVTACNGSLRAKGYLTQTSHISYYKGNGYDTGMVLGKNGFLQIIKDTGGKMPYSSKCKILTGQIYSDFAYYFTASENRPCAIVSGEIIREDKVKSMAMIAEPLPDCPDEIITVIEDILTNFKDFSAMIEDYSYEEIFEKHFGHFDYKKLESRDFKYECDCSDKKIDEVILSLGKDEAFDILEKEGRIEVKCEFCEKNYIYDKEKLTGLFKNDN